MDNIPFTIVLLTSCTYACVYGGAPERIASCLLFCAAVASAFSGVGPQGYRAVEWINFSIDCALLAALLVLALNANRYWPLWITSMQVVTVSSHLAFATLDVRAPWAYAIASTIWAYPSQIILAIGTFRHQERTKRNGADPPWNGSLRR